MSASSGSEPDQERQPARPAKPSRQFRLPKPGLDAVRRPHMPAQRLASLRIPQSSPFPPGRAFAAFVAIFAVAVLCQWPALAQPDGAPHTTSNDLTSIVIESFVILGLVLLAGLLNLSLEALVTVRRARIDQLVEEGNAAAKRVARLSERAAIMIPTLLVGATLLALLSMGTAVDRLSPAVTSWLASLFPQMAAPVVRVVSLFSVFTGVSLLFLVFGVIVPKSIGIARAETIALRLSGVVAVALALLSPLIAVVMWLSGIVLRPFGATATFSASALSEDDLKIMVEQSEEFGVIEAAEKEMLHNVFGFADTMVRKVMTPRLDITALTSDATVDDLVALAGDSGHSRFPVYEEDLDHIVGAIHIKDVLKTLARSKGSNGSKDRPIIRDYMRPPYFVPETKRVDDLLAEFQRGKLQLAIVRDEYGTVTGVVTIEDLLEEIVGEIQDEYDQEEPEMRQVDANTCIVDARMAIDEFNDRLGAELPSDEADTLGGFVFGLVGHQPILNESAQWDGMQFAVEATDGKRILRVRVAKCDNNPADFDENHSIMEHEETAHDAVRLA